MNIPSDDPRAVSATLAIHTGDFAALRRLLAESPDLATARIVDARGAARTLLHVAVDSPGHYPNGAATITELVEADADVNAPMIGPHGETPLHWAASNDDVVALDALLDAGANIEAPGAVLTGGTPLSDAVVFAQWHAARRLLERGARTTIWQAAALGLLDRVEEYWRAETPPSPGEVTNAFWAACRGGQPLTAKYLLERGADLNWVGYDRRTPLQAARESGAEDLIAWLRSQGARVAAELG